MAFEIPEGLNPQLMALAWMVGRWEGTCKGQWPDQGEFEYAAQLDFSHNGGPYLYYVGQLFEVDDQGNVGATTFMESGFWRPQADASLEIVMAHPAGIAGTANAAGWLFGVFAVAPGIAIFTALRVIRCYSKDQAITAGHR